MEIICLEEKAFFEILDRVYSRLKTTYSIKEDYWISDDEAMKKLRITSKTTLQKYRDEGKIRYSELSPKHFLYHTESINAYIESKSKDTF